MSELRGLGAIHRQLAGAGVQLVAVWVDPPEKSRQAIAQHDLPFSILSDTEAKVIRQYGLLHADGSPFGGDIAVPAQVLIDQDGAIIWRRMANRITDRPDPEQVLAAARSAT